MNPQSNKLPTAYEVATAGWITVGGGCPDYHRVVPRAPDMSWLGAPPSARAAARYEVARVLLHREALSCERRSLEARAIELSEAWCETPAQRKRVTDELNSIHAQLSKRCDCDMCRE